MDFISHVLRCMELVDLGEYNAAEASCALARERDPVNLWGPMTTAWIFRAQGRIDEAIQWIDTARKLAPHDAYLAEQKIDLLLAKGQSAEARAVMHEIPADGNFFTLSRESAIVYQEGGSEAVKAWLVEHGMAKRAGTGAELAELARLQLMAQDAVAARATLAHAERVLPLSTADLFDGSQIRFEYSAAVVRAGIELKGGGDKSKALKILADFDRLLEKYEQDGGRHYGMHTLRAESLALQGRKREAQASLDKAWKAGWRATWRVRRESTMEGLQIPQ
jgi:tetratricopeptide (TPR) repeat protein